MLKRTLGVLFFLITPFFSYSDSPNIYEKIIETAYLTPEQKEECSILARSPEKKEYGNAFSKTTLEDFEILRGRHYPEYNLLSRIDLTESLAGHIELARELMIPSDKIDVLTQKQEIIREMLENEVLFQQLDEMVKKFRKIEPIILSFFQNDHTKNTDETDETAEKDYRYVLRDERLSRFISDIFFLLSEENKKKLEKKIDFLDKMPALLEFIPYIKLTGQAASVLGSLLYSAEFINIVGDGFKALKGDPTAIEDVKIDLFKSSYGVQNTIPKTLEEGKYLQAAMDSVSLGKHIAINLTSPLTILVSVQQLAHFSKELYKGVLQAHGDFIALGTFINNTLKNTNSHLLRSRTLQLAVPELSTISRITYNTTQPTKDFEQLLSLLDTRTFKGNPSAIFSQKGKMIALYKLFETEKKYLIPLCSVIGKLDAYLSLAKLYRQAKGAYATYEFVHYKQEASPEFQIKEFWNPFIKREIVVTNSLVPQAPGKGRCIVLTGPNAGGKSTAMKSIAANMIMAQTCGLAPSRYLCITPFSYIDSHLNVTDDIASQKSLYVAEATHIKKLIETIEGMPKGTYAFVVIDELFSSTNSDSGGSIDRAIGHYIASTLTNCSCILASHLTDIVKLETDTDGVFKNYRVMVNRETFVDTNGKSRIKITYPYKIEPGMVDQSVAIDILEELEFTNAIVNESRILYSKKKSSQIK